MRGLALSVKNVFYGDTSVRMRMVSLALLCYRWVFIKALSEISRKWSLEFATSCRRRAITIEYTVAEVASMILATSFSGTWEVAIVDGAVVVIGLVEVNSVLREVD